MQAENGILAGGGCRRQGVPAGPAQVQTYAQPAMAWAVAENIIRGMEDGTLKPAGNASRAQIATILMRFCEDVAQ